MSKKTHLHTETKIKSMELTATATTESKKRKSVIVLQVLIQETGERRIAALGAVHESYDCHKMPGWDSGTVGYHIDEGKIFETGFHKLGREVEGMGYFDGRFTIFATRICWRLET